MGGFQSQVTFLQILGENWSRCSPHGGSEEPGEHV